MRQLILASASPRRSELLKHIADGFAVISANAEELQDGEDPFLLSEINAELKASDVSAKHPDALVLGADTMIIFNGRAIGKPNGEKDALEMLMMLSGKMHHVVTGIALCCQADEQKMRWHEISEVYFKKFDLATAMRYITEVDVLDKAGAYAVQEHGDMIVDRFSGELENIIGLPLKRLQKVLRNYTESGKLL